MPGGISGKIERASNAGGILILRVHKKTPVRKRTADPHTVVYKIKCINSGVSENPFVLGKKIRYIGDVVARKDQRPGNIVEEVVDVAPIQGSKTVERASTRGVRRG